MGFKMCICAAWSYLACDTGQREEALAHRKLYLAGCAELWRVRCQSRWQRVAISGGNVTGIFAGC
jgi:hypothetical protein